jgi:beta-galactosidase
MNEQSSVAQPLTRRLPSFFYGGDYNPEQWTATFGANEEEIWREDVRLMRLAHVNVATIGVFSWVSLQPDEHTFTFEWLDRVLDLLAENQIFACLATATAAQPAWLSAAYPDVLPVDEQGVRHGQGARQNYCPTSPDFRRLSQNLARHLAQRYSNHPALLLWHVSNEYYGGGCYCERCASRFRDWLRACYGSLDAVNLHWNTAFWSHTYTAWEQVVPPGPRTEVSVQGLTLDYKRFISDMYLECYRGEADILHEVTPAIPVTTNFMGVYRNIDYFSWAPYLDFACWDSYPMRTTHPAEIAFAHDLTRGVRNGQSWLLMEQTPSQTQWRPYNPLKRPGVLRQHSFQAVAHGADAVMYFQWRQSRGSFEMFHGAIVSHVGHEHTRVFNDVARIGTELAELDNGILGTRLPTRVAMIFDWSNWWNVEFTPGLSNALNYNDEILLYYQALWERNIAVDVVSPNGDLSGYDLVIAPLLNMVSKEQGTSIESFVEQGGTFVTGYFSGVVDTDTRAWLGGYPGPLRKALGIWVEEFDPLDPEQSNMVVVAERGQLPAGSYRCDRWCDLVNLEGAIALATYGEDFYVGRPAITEHTFGKGKAIYVATHPEKRLVDALVGSLLDELKIAGPLSVPTGVEVTKREGNGQSYLFMLNYNDDAVQISLPEAMDELLNGGGRVTKLELPAKGVAILRTV